MLHAISPRVAARQAARDDARASVRASYAPLRGPNRAQRRHPITAIDGAPSPRSNRPDASTLPLESARRARRTRVRAARQAGRNAR